MRNFQKGDIVKAKNGKTVTNWDNTTFKVENLKLEVFTIRRDGSSDDVIRVRVISEVVPAELNLRNLDEYWIKCSEFVLDEPKYPELISNCLTGCNNLLSKLWKN